MVRILILLAACGSTAPSPSPAEWTDFYGIQYQAPPGTDVHITRSVLPGPGGLGGSPTDERPYVTLAMGGDRSFYVTITKTGERETLDAAKQSSLANQLGTEQADLTTATGWELTYRRPRSDDPKTLSTVHLIYADLAGGHYQCIYDEQNCRAPALADAICRSMRAKR